MIARQIHAMQRRQREGRRRGEAGFSLVATLMIMGVAFLLVSALLLITLTTTRVSNEQEDRGREWRAADGAMDAAVNQILQDASAKMGSLTEAQCEPVQEMTIDNMDVEVKCAAEASDQPFVPVEQAPNQYSVRVVGNTYRGEPSNLPTPAKAWNQTPAQCPAIGGDLNGNCFPWAEALSAFGGWRKPDGTLDTDSVTARVLGVEPLQIIGSMGVKEGTAPLRATRNSSGAITGDGPAIAVRGEYAQGDRGLLQGLTGDLTGGGTETTCGILSPKQEVVNVRNSNILTVDGLYCSDAPATGGRERAGGLSATDVDIAGWVKPARANFDPAAPCPSGKRVDLPAGSYDAAQSKRLNEWFRTNNCDFKVFVFAPGAYWFDVDAAPAGGEPWQWRNELRFRDSTSVVVFGTVAPEAATVVSAPQPAQEAAKVMTAGAALCASDRPGVTITLSGRTSIRHESGRVAICGANTANNLSDRGLVNRRAVQQAPTVNLGWESSPTRVKGGIQTDCIETIDILGDIACWTGWDAVKRAINSVWEFFGGSAPFDTRYQRQYNTTSFPVGAYLDCPGTVTPEEWSAQCWVDTRMLLDGWTPPPDDDLGAAIDSAELILQSETRNGDRSGRFTRVDVYLKPASQLGPGDTPRCSVTYHSVNDSSAPEVLELIKPDLSKTAKRTPGIPLCGDPDPANPGKAYIHDRSQLYSSTIDVWVKGHRESWGSFGTVITGAKLRTGRTATNGPIVIDGEAGRVDGVGVGQINVVCWIDDRWWNIAADPICDDHANAEFELPAVAAGQTDFANIDATSPGYTDPIANPRLTGLGITLTGLPSSANFYNAWDSRNLLTVEIVGSGDQVWCRATYGPEYFPHRGDPIKYINLLSGSSPPLASGANGGCASTQVANWRASDLRNTKVRLTFNIRQTSGENSACKSRVAGAWWNGFLDLLNYIDLFGIIPDEKCNGWGLRIDNIAINPTYGDCRSGLSNCTTTAASVYRGPTSLMTVTSANQPRYRPPSSDVDAANATDAVFNVYGDVALPRTDLDMVWKGAYSTDPFVTGNLWVNGLGSYPVVDPRSLDPASEVSSPHTGVICCGPAKPAERIVRLEAWVEGALRGVARVRISDTKIELLPSGDPTAVPPALGDEVWDPGQSVRIASWQLCNNPPQPGPVEMDTVACRRS